MRRPRPGLVGAFVLGALALAVVAILFFGRIHLFAQTGRAAIVFEESVAGLDIGAPVTLGGVDVGTVREIAVHVTAAGKALITVVIELLPARLHPAEGNGLDIQRLVAQGLRAQIEPVSLVTGDLRVGLSFRPDTPATLTAGDTGDLPQIPTVPSDFEQLRTTLSQVPIRDLIAAMHQSLVEVAKVAAKLDSAADPLISGAQRDMDAAAHAADAAQQSVTALQKDVSKTLGEIDTLTRDARLQLEDRGAEISRLARQTETLVTALNGLIGTRTQFRGDLEAAARDLAASSSALRGFAQTIERDPSSILRGR